MHCRAVRTRGLQQRAARKYLTCNDDLPDAGLHLDGSAVKLPICEGLRLTLLQQQLAIHCLRSSLDAAEKSANYIYIQHMKYLKLVDGTICGLALHVQGLGRPISPLSTS